MFSYGKNTNLFHNSGPAANQLYEFRSMTLFLGYLISYLLKIRKLGKDIFKALTITQEWSLDTPLAFSTLTQTDKCVSLWPCFQASAMVSWISVSWLTPLVPIKKKEVP